MNKREYINDKYYIEKVGVGKPLYIIGGGPGMDYVYLYKWLIELSGNRELIFYNQYGLNNGEETSFDILVEQLHVILTSNSDKKDVLVHSFGSHLLFSALSKYDDLNIDKIIMINPCPTNYTKYIKSEEVLSNRIPESIKEKIEYFSNQHDKYADLNVFTLLIPYYVYKGVSIDFCIYNSNMCDKINSQLGDFDFSDLIKSLPNDILLIKGDNDFINITATLDIQIMAKKTVIYKECGHFAFAEKNNEVLNEVRKFLD